MGKTHYSYSIEYFEGMLEMANIPDKYKSTFIKLLEMNDNLINALREVEKSDNDGHLYSRDKVISILEKCFVD